MIGDSSIEIRDLVEKMIVFIKVILDWVRRRKVYLRFKGGEVIKYLFEFY